MLTIKRPTSTTVLYKVSSRAPAIRFTIKIQRFLAGVLRIIASLLILLLLYSKFQSTTNPAHEQSTTRPIFAFLATWPNPLASTPAASILHQTPWLYLLPLSLLSLYLCLRKGYTEESLLVIRGLGLQTSSGSATYLSSADTRFIPTSAIQDIFVHEAFKGFEVRFYLVVVVEGEEDLVVVFPKMLPRRQLLEEVWRGTKACLYEPK